MATLRVKDSRKVWKVPGVPVNTGTALDVKRHIHSALGLIGDPKHLKLSESKGNEACSYHEATSDWQDSDSLASAGLRVCWRACTCSTIPRSTRLLPVLGHAQGGVV